MNYRTKGKGKNRKTYPVVGSKRNASVEKHISSKELADLRRVGITHPGSLTDLGYHIDGKPASQKALNTAITKYGKEDTLRKLQDLYRLDYHKPKLKGILEKNINYVRDKK